MSAYKQAGVDVEKADKFVQTIQDIKKAGCTVFGTLKSSSGYGSLYKVPVTLSNPVIVTSTDGVGTKVLLALDHPNQSQSIFNIGIDLVAMCVNDILCENAHPVQFLDYYATSAINNNSIDLIKGIVHGCSQANCELVGGETAEMPGLYCENEFDVAGFAIGIADGNKLFNPSNIKEGDIVFGLPSSGFHSNGFSLIRKLLSENPHNHTLLESILTPTKIYVNDIACVTKVHNIQLKGVAHITGGGWYRNLARILPPNVKAVLQNTYDNDVFDWVQTVGQLSDYEMYSTFNCGIGMMLVVEDQYRASIKRFIPNIKELGIIINRSSVDEEQLEISHGRKVNKIDYRLIVR